MDEAKKLCAWVIWLSVSASGGLFAQTIATRTQVDPRDIHWRTSVTKTQPWKKRAYTEWTDQDLREIALYSPWAFSVKVSKAQKVPVVVGGDGEVIYIPSQTMRVSPGVTMEAPGRMLKPEQRTVMVDPAVMVRWLSSRIMRELAARMNQVPEAEARGLIGAQAAHYEILVSGAHVPKMQEACTTLLEKCLREAAFLRLVDSRNELRPVRVELRPPKNENERPEVSFFFDRAASGKPLIHLREKNVLFRWESPAGIIEAVFNLKDMGRDGTPDI